MQPFNPSAGAYARQRVDPLEARARFIVRTYNHLFGAIILFAMIEVGLFMTGIAPVIAKTSRDMRSDGFGMLNSRSAQTNVLLPR